MGEQSIIRLQKRSVPLYWEGESGAGKKPTAYWDQATQTVYDSKGKILSTGEGVPEGMEAAPGALGPPAPTRPAPKPAPKPVEPPPLPHPV